MRVVGEIEAERRAGGRRISAIINKIGAENKRREISMEIKTNRVFIPLTIRLLFSSLENKKPIIWIYYMYGLMEEEGCKREEWRVVMGISYGYGL